LHKQIKSFCIELLNLLLPDVCLICGTLNETNLCKKCEDRILAKPKYQAPHQDRDELFTYFEYKDIHKELLHKFKFEAYLNMGQLLNKKLTACLEDFPWHNFDVITYIPSHKLRIKKRGFHHLDFLFANFKQSNKFCQVLERIKYTPFLYNLDMQKRAQVLRDAFALSVEPSLVYQKQILLLDDIYTTGATIKEAAKVLFKMGAKKVSALTFAYVPSK
jgi:competence protein ComFC